MNTDYTRFGRQVGYILAANIAIAILVFILLPILTKGLGADLYGTWSLINVTVGLLVSLASLGLVNAVLRFLTAEKDYNKVNGDFLSVLAVVCISGISLSIVLFLFSDLLAEYIFNNIGSSFYIKLASVLVFFNTVSGLALAFFRLQIRIGLIASLNLASNIFNVGLVVVALLLGYSLTGVIVATIISAGLFLVLELLIILMQTGLYLPRFSNIKSYLRWSLPLTPNFAIMWIIVASDRYIVSYFMGTAATGIYSAAYSLSSQITFILPPIALVLFPSIIKSYDEGRINETRTYLKYSLKYFMMITIPFAFGMTILAKPLLSILTQPAFVVGATIIPFITFGNILFGLDAICVCILFIAHRTHLRFWLLGLAASLNIILNLILIPLFGIVGAAIATCIAYSTLGIMTLLISRRYLKFDLSLSFILKSIFASIIMILCIWLHNPEVLLQVLVSILYGVLIYFSVLFLVRGISKPEIKFFMNLATENIKKVHPSLRGGNKSR